MRCQVCGTPGQRDGESCGFCGATVRSYEFQLLTSNVPPLESEFVPPRRRRRPRDGRRACLCVRAARLSACGRCPPAQAGTQTGARPRNLHGEGTQTSRGGTRTGACAQPQGGGRHRIDARQRIRGK